MQAPINITAARTIAILCLCFVLSACGNARSEPNAVEQLQTKLLSLGGKSVQQQEELDAQNILSRGVAEQGKNARLLLGYDNNCHLGPLVGITGQAR